MSDAGSVEEWVYQGGTFTNTNSWMQGGSGSGGNMILEWNTDVATTRKQVKQKQRKSGMQISYNHPDNGWTNEQYIGTTFTDTVWGNDVNWKKIINEPELTKKILKNNQLYNWDNSLNKGTIQSSIDQLDKKITSAIGGEFTGEYEEKQETVIYDSGKYYKPTVGEPIPDFIESGGYYSTIIYGLNQGDLIKVVSARTGDTLFPAWAFKDGICITSFGSNQTEYSESNPLNIEVTDEFDTLIFNSYQTKGQLEYTHNAKKTTAVKELITKENISEELDSLITDKGLVNKDELQTELDYLADVSIAFEDGYIYSATNIGNVVVEKIANKSFSCCKATCKEGNKFLITGTGGSGSSRLWAFLDKDNTVISIAESGEKAENKELIAPELSTYIISTVSNGNAYSIIRASDSLIKKYIETSAYIEKSSSKNLIDKSNLLKNYSCNSSGVFSFRKDGIMSNKIYINNGETITLQGIKPYSSSEKTCVCYFDKYDNFIGYSNGTITNQEEQISTTQLLSNGFYYIRIVIKYDNIGIGGEDNIQCEIGNSATEITDYVGNLVKEVYYLTEFNSESRKDIKILLTGASFSESINDWGGRMAEILNAELDNQSVGGSSIHDTALKLYKGTYYTKDTLDDIDIFMIMHVHDQNVNNGMDLKTISQYEENGEEGFSLSSMSYSQAFDYTIKKYIYDCYNQKNNENSIWHNVKHGKPAVILMCTSWNDVRTTYNSSIRDLCKKFGLYLVEFDINIGFSDSEKNPATDEYTSLIYAQDTSGEHGWHPLRDKLPNGDISYVQNKMAIIAANKIKEIMGL